jgi:hypothetical protein
MVSVIGWGQDVQEASGLGHSTDLVLVVHVWHEVAGLLALVAGSGSTGLRITGPPPLEPTEWLACLQLVHAAEVQCAMEHIQHRVQAWVVLQWDVTLLAAGTHPGWSHQSHRFM